MDRALKERILGSAILVVVIVIVVPVFLDGSPDRNELVSERVSLPGQSDQAVQTVVLNRDRKDPAPAATSNGSGGTTPAPQQEVLIVAAAEKLPATTAQPSQPTIEPPVQTSPRIATGSATGMWVVQLGSFSERKNAERLASDLRKQGFAAFLSQLATESGQLHRVRIGPQKDRESAEAMAERLGQVGHKGKVLPHP